MYTFEHKLHIAIKKLSQKSANAQLWNNISEQLNFNATLHQKTKELPTHKPLEHMWIALETRITNVRKPILYFRFAYAAAASVAIILGVGTYLLFPEQPKISIAEEMVEAWPNTKNIQSDTAVASTLRYIASFCSNKSYLANEPDFCEKSTQLNVINAELNKLEFEISTLGSSQSLILTQIRLQNSKAALIKDLVNKLKS